MDRRSFLRGLAGIAAAPAVFAEAVALAPTAAAAKPCLPVACPGVETTLVAFCAPLAPMFDFATATRPVEDSLSIVRPPRGGIRFASG